MKVTRDFPEFSWNGGSDQNVATNREKLKGRQRNNPSYDVVV